MAVSKLVPLQNSFDIVAKEKAARVDQHVQELINVMEKMRLHNRVCQILVDELPKVDYSSTKRALFYLNVWKRAPHLSPRDQTDLLKCLAAYT